MELNIGDKVIYRKDGKLYEGKIKSFKGDKIEIDDDTIELVIMAISKDTIAEDMIHNPVTNTDYKIKHRSTKYGDKGEIEGMWTK